MDNKDKAWLILPLLCIENRDSKYSIIIGWLTYTITFNLEYNG